MQRLKGSSIYKILKSFRLWIILIFSITFIVTGLNISGAYFLQAIIGAALDNNELHQPLLVLMVSVVVTGIVFRYLFSYMVNRVGIFFGKDLRNAVFDSLINSKLKMLDKFTHGAIISKVNVELEELVSFVTTNLASILFQPLMFFGAAIYMIILDWKLFLACFVLSPMFLFVINKLSKKSAMYSEVYYKNLSKTNGIILDSMQNIEIIKSYNMIDDFLSRFDKRFENILKSVSKSEKLDAFSLPFYFFISDTPKIICLLFGGFLALNGRMPLESLVAFIYLLTFVDSPLMSMTYIFGAIRRFRVQLININELLNLESEENQLKKPLESDLSKISVKNISFMYNEGEEILRNFSLEIENAEKIALIGESGSGKSTLFYILCGFYDINEGAYLLNGLEHTNYSLQAIRSNITYVSQKPYFLHNTIRENLIFGREGITDDDIYKAIETVGLKDYIKNLPDGYETIIEERGHNLSGGEQARMNIARAFIRPANLIILDEPTASLDAENESRLLQNILLYYPDKVILLSSHRSSTIQKMTRIICLKDGSIVEDGNVGQLLQENSFFHRFINNLSHKGRCKFEREGRIII